jgi:hypothetical protein
MEYSYEDENAAFLSSLKAARTDQSVRENRHWGTLSLTLFGLLMTALVIGGVSTAAYQQGLTVRLREQAQPTAEMSKVLGDCGDNPAEARQRGCMFDTISFTWDLPACFNAELVDDYRRQYGFRYYEDRAGVVEVPYEIVALGERDLHSSWEQHLIHCIYTWRKFHNAWNFGLPVDSYISNVNHTHHCGEEWIEQLYSPLDISSINSMIFVKYPNCVTNG